MRILVADKVAREGLEILERVGTVDIATGLKPDELIAKIGEYDGLVVRSETQVTADVINAGVKLRVIGRAGVGVDNIDVDAATQRGITVVNAPTGNTIAATEHTIALLLAMARHIPQAYRSFKDHKWERSKFVGVEVRNKILGVVGLGKIGTEVARRAIGLDMRILAFDPYVTAEHARTLGVEVAELDQVLRQADFLTIHTPLTANTKKLIGAEELATMKPTARVINCARGGIIDEEALFAAVQNGTIAGAAVDVFTQEPTTDNILIESDKIIVTPHLGASTEEAQVQVAIDVAEQIVAMANGQPARYAVNLPRVAPETMAALSPYLPLAELLGKMAIQLAPGRTKSVTVTYSGEIAEHDTAMLKASLIKGFMSQFSDEEVNLVNASLIAKQRNLPITEQKSPAAENFSSLLRLSVDTEQGQTSLAGTVMRGEPHVVHAEGYWGIDIVPTGNLLFVQNIDQPGMIGRLGTLLGENGINISFMQVGRDHPRGRALMVVGVDEPIGDQVLAKISAIPGLGTPRLVRL